MAKKIKQLDKCPKVFKYHNEIKEQRAIAFRQGWTQGVKDYATTLSTMGLETLSIAKLKDMLKKRPLL